MTDDPYETKTLNISYDIDGDIREHGEHPLPPSGDTFFEAWQWPAAPGMPIKVNMESARLIQADRIRIERAKAWPMADRDWNVAMEDGELEDFDKASDYRRILRAAPKSPLLAEAKTDIELANITLTDIVNRAMADKEA